MTHVMMLFPIILIYTPVIRFFTDFYMPVMDWSQTHTSLYILCPNYIIHIVCFLLTHNYVKLPSSLLFYSVLTM